MTCLLSGHTLLPWQSDHSHHHYPHHRQLFKCFSILKVNVFFNRSEFNSVKFSFKCNMELSIYINVCNTLNQAAMQINLSSLSNKSCPKQKRIVIYLCSIDPFDQWVYTPNQYTRMHIQKGLILFYVMVLKDKRKYHHRDMVHIYIVECIFSYWERYLIKEKGIVYSNLRGMTAETSSSPNL